ncbi:MAG: ABC transporter permease [Bacillota bacterium]|nr:ABC transporter permease [Bacillota bacterium]
MTEDKQAGQEPGIQNPWRTAAGSFLASRTAVVGMSLILMLLLFGAVGPVVAQHDPIKQDLLNRFLGPSSVNWLGTDHMGRDLFSRLAYGARLSLTLSLTAVVIGVGVGVPIGIFSGFRGGAVDNVIMRLVDVMMAIPTYLLAILVASLIGRPTIMIIATAVAVSMLPGVVRMSRAETLGIKTSAMVEAANALGVPTGRLFFRHILPNILGPIVVLATLRMGTAILVEASLSFLGLGLSVPTPAWGLMINDGLKYIDRNSWMSILPGLAIMFTVLGFNLMGDGLRDALDPRLRGR